MMRCSKVSYGSPKREGFGTLSWQLGNDEGYRSSRVGVSGCFTR